MLSPRYLLCFIILLDAETCFVCSTKSIYHLSLTCCCGRVSLIPSIYSEKFYFRQKSMTDHNYRASKEEQFWEVFVKKWRTKISSIFLSSARQCLLLESPSTFPSPSTQTRLFIKEFLSLSQEIKRRTN